MPADKEQPIQVLGRYAICDVLGAGGMATVHVGRLLGPVGFARTVAIKKMHAHLAKDPQFVAMFLEEAQIAARVQHANVVATLDVVSEDGQLFHVMEYVAGESLAKVLWVLSKSNTRLPANVAGTIISQALHGLHAVHEVRGDDGRPLGLIHRDISPDNVLVGRDGNARVLDFGIAKATELGRKTKAGQIKGKIAYMSPEHMRGKDLDRRADIYAMGAVLFEVLTGRRLVGGETDAEIIHQALTLQAKPPSSIIPSISAAIDQLVMRALDPERERRFATAREMALEVENALGVASPTAVGHLVESIVGKDLDKKAALVDSAVKRSSQLSPVKSPDSAHVRRSTAETEAAMPSPFQAGAGQASTSVDGTKEDASRGSRPAPREGGTGSSGTNVMDFPDLLGGPSPAMALPSLPGLDSPRPVSPPAPQQAVAARPQAAAPAGLSLELDAHPAGPVHGDPRTRPPAPEQPPAARSAAPPPAPIPDESGGGLDIDFGPAPRGHGMPASPMGPHGAAPRPMGGGMPSPHYPVAGHAAAAGSTRSGGGASPAIIVPVVLGAFIIVAVALVVVFRRSPATSSASPVTAPPPTQEEVASCDVLRKHLKKGGQATGQSRAGWAVELWLRGKDGARIDASAIDKAVLAPSASDVVEVTTLRVSGRSFDEGTLVRVRGPSTETAFDDAGALRLVRAADQAFVKTGAEVGALYLKCAHLPHHDVGLWFRGPDVKQASSSLLFSMGLFSEITVVREELLETPDMRPEMTMFERIRAKVGGKQPKSLDADLQGYGGTLDEPEGGGVRITFPTSHLGSAARASRVVADRAGIENL